MKKNNSGFSLIELVAVIAIMVVLSTAIIGFLVAGLRQYQEANSEVNRQTEAQLVLNQIQDLLIDTSNGVNYDDSAKELWAYNVETETGSAVYTAVKINWNAADGELLFSKYICDPQPTGVYNMTAESEDQLLGENVTDFSVDLSDLDSMGKITISLQITLRGKSYQTQGVVTLRNKVKEVSDENEAFQETTAELDAIATNVTISPSSVYVWQGSSYSGFNASVNGVNYPMQDVAWSFSATTLASLTDAGTVIDPNSGAIRLGDNEQCQVLTVEATSVESKKDSAPENSWVSGTATVFNKYITGIQIGTLENTGNMGAEAAVTVNGVNFEGDEDLSDYISFKITNESGTIVNDITTSVRLASSQAVTGSAYIFKANAPASYVGKKLNVCPVINFNGKTWTGNTSSITFLQRDVIGFTMQMQEEDGTWVDCGNTTYTANRGEELSFRVKVSYGTGSTVDYQGYWEAGDSDWSNLKWSIKKGGVATSDYGSVSEIASKGILTIEGLSRYSASSSYSFSVSVEYQGSNASVSGNVNIVIPEVGMSILERHDSQSKEFMTVGDSQTIHFVVAGLDPSLYNITLGSEDSGVMQQSSVKTSGSMAILSPQTSGSSNMTFYLVDKQGSFIQKGSQKVSAALPLEVGNKNMYLRTGAFGNYGYTLADSAIYIPQNTYSTSGTVMYSLSGMKVEYKTSVGILGTTKTVNINDSSIAYTGTTYNGEYIWYR